MLPGGQLSYGINNNNKNLLSYINNSSNNSNNINNNTNNADINIDVNRN